MTSKVMTPIPLVTVTLPIGGEYENMHAAYRDKGIACAEQVEIPRTYRLKAKPRTLELGIVTVADLIRRPLKDTGRVHGHGDFPFEPEFGGISLRQIYDGIQNMSGLLLTRHEAFWLPLVLKAPVFATEKSEKNAGKTKEGCWYRFAMSPTLPIKGCARILCYGSDQNGPRVDVNPADEILQWAPVERFVYVISRQMITA